MKKSNHQTLLLRFILFGCLVFVFTQSHAFDPYDSDFFAGLKTRSIGPAGMSGRIAAVDVVFNNPRIIYVGTATGGIWKSIDGGVTWKPIFDDQSTSSIGDVTIVPDNPETIWVGTGEANPRNSAGVGRGVFKTLNGGETWQFLGLEKTERISRVLVNPHRPDTAFVAAMGTTWGENPERGIFKTIDGGKTWKNVLYVDEKTGAADLVMDPRNPDRLLAAMWEHRRWPWFFNSGGPGSGLYLSVDGGETWCKMGLKDGLPKGDLGRIGLAFSRSQPNIVYALVEAKKSALCRSEDSGKTWKIVNDKPGVSPRPFYYSDIRIHPTQENTVYRLSGSLDVSLDGGKTFKRLIPFLAVHGDFHELWIHPEDCDFMVVGSDGGIAFSYDGGKHWNFVQNLPLGQYYHINIDMEKPYNIYGGMQDNGAWRGPSQVFAGLGIFNFHWQSVGRYGDTFAVLPIPRDSKIGYVMFQGGYLSRFKIETGERKDIRPPAPEGVKLHFSWNAAIAINPFNPQILYCGSQFVHKSTDEGQNWEIISPDLTTNDPEKQKQTESGGLTKDVTFAENHCTIITISPSPVQNGLTWVGTDDGKVHLTRDEGKSWKDLSQKLTGKKKGGAVPPATWIPHIEASHHHVGTAYVVLDDHRRANWTPYVFMTQDYGETWKSLATSDIDGFVHVIREDPVQKNLLFLGTEFGLYVSFDRGGSWMKWTHGLPTVPVRDMVIHPRDHDLIIGTHGRSAYILDDIQPLRELNKDIPSKKVHLFSVADAYQFRTSFPGHGYLTPGDMEFQGENRKYGALITYSIGKEKTENKKEKTTSSKPPKGTEAQHEGTEKEKAQDKVVIEILNSEGEVVRTLKGPKKLGLNRINWDLRHAPFKSLSGLPWGAFFLPSWGSNVSPGPYRVRIKLDDEVVETPITVFADPRDQVSDKDRKEKYDLVMKNGKYIEAVTDAYKKIEKSLEAINEVLKRIDQFEEEKQKTIKTKGQTLKEKLKAISLRLAPPKDKSIIMVETTKLEPLLVKIGLRMETSSDAPTAGQLAQFKVLEAKVKEEIKNINQLFEGEYKEYVQKVKKAGLNLLPKIETISIEE